MRHGGRMSPRIVWLAYSGLALAALVVILRNL
jgi:hypothetical protein